MVKNMSKRYLNSLLFLALVFFLTGVNAAENLQCNELSYPYCVYDSATYTDQSLFDACSEKVQQYNSEKTAYTACLKERFIIERDTLLKRQAEEADQLSKRQQAEINSVLNQGNELIKVFNCMQEKNKTCY